MIHLLLKQPHSSSYVQDCTLDDDVYTDLIADNWRFAINQTEPGRCYINIYRFTEGKREQRLLHRHLAFLGHKIFKGVQVHHRDRNGCNNCLDNLQPLSIKEHRKFHPKKRSLQNDRA